MYEMQLVQISLMYSAHMEIFSEFIWPNFEKKKSNI